MIDNEPEWEVDFVLDKRYDKYLVKWKGYDVSEATWEPEENLENAKQALEDFLKRYHGT